MLPMAYEIVTSHVNPVFLATGKSQVQQYDQIQVTLSENLHGDCSVVSLEMANMKEWHTMTVSLKLLN